MAAKPIVDPDIIVALIFSSELEAFFKDSDIIFFQGLSGYWQASIFSSISSDHSRNFPANYPAQA